MKPPDLAPTEKGAQRTRAGWTKAEERALRANWRGNTPRHVRALALALHQAGYPLRTNDSLKSKAVRLGLEAKTSQGLISFSSWCKANKVGDDTKLLKATAHARGLLIYQDRRLYLRPANEVALVKALVDCRAGGLPIKTVARRLGVAISQVGAWVRAGRVKARKVSARIILIDEGDVAALAAHQAKYRNLVAAGVLLDLDAIAAMAGCPRRTAQKAFQDGRLRGERVWWPGMAGHPRWLAHIEDVRQWMRRNQ